MARSRYDALHDRFDPIKTGKAGTRYERLAAMVLKSLELHDAVVHDMRIVGTSDVKHQIDVTVSKGDQNRRMLVECKDFDVRGAKVGLDIVRSFRSVLEDAGIGEGLILTCNGFTRDAAKFASSKGIKLALLRDFREEDKEGRIQKIILHMTMRVITAVKLKYLELSIDNEEKFRSQMKVAGLSELISSEAPLYFVRDAVRIQFLGFLCKLVEEDAGDKSAGTYSLRSLSNGWQISITNASPIDFVYVDLEYTISEAKETNEITSKRVAELILCDFSDTDIIIYDDQLKRCRIDGDGNVLEQDDAI